MLSAVKYKILDLLNKGHERTVKAKKHIFASFLVKGLRMAVGFLIVPLTLQYIHKEDYGIWLTLSSVIGWFTFFDVGLGHGLRNKLAEALANDDLEKAKIYVSTTYGILSIIFIGILLLFFALNPFLNWSNILNTSPERLEELRMVALVTFSFFCLSFVLRLLYTLFMANQQPAYVGTLNLVSGILSLAIIFILTKTTEGSLFNLALVLGAVPFIILLGASVFFFFGEFKAIAPSPFYIRMEYFKDLINLGVKFFIIGLTGLVIFSTDNMIIIQLYGPSEVPAYNIAHKFFGIVTTAFSIISLPFWSAYTEAYVKEDMNWILSTNKSLIKVWVLCFAGSLFMLVISEPFYNLWVPEIDVPFQLSLFMLIYVVILAWGNIFVMFINGVGKVKLQLVTSVVGALLNIPLSIFFAKYCGLGTAGVILASTISIGYGPILAPIQFRKITSGNAKGIWAK